MKEGVKMFEAKEKERQQKLAEYAEQEKFVKDMKELQKSQATKQWSLAVLSLYSLQGNCISVSAVQFICC